PALRYGNLPDSATPSGVPVLTRSPGSRRTYCDRSRISSATPKTMSEVFESCRGSPFTNERSPRSCGSTSSAGISAGPSGLKVSQLLPFPHWPPDPSICRARSDTSFEIVYAATQASASCGDDRYRAVRPTTTPSSTSQSVLTEPPGITTSSYGPTTVFGCL